MDPLFRRVVLWLRFGAWGARAVLFGRTEAARKVVSVAGGPLAMAKAGAGRLGNEKNGRFNRLTVKHCKVTWIFLMDFLESKVIDKIH